MKGQEEGEEGEEGKEKEGGGEERRRRKGRRKKNLNTYQYFHHPSPCVRKCRTWLIQKTNIGIH